MDKKVSLMIVPTGIGASIGGYAGDASQTAQKISANIPLIVNPNIVNAAVFSGITDNMFYVEGWAIEQFVKGSLGLLPSKNNKIGVIFDRAVPPNVLNIHINTINALKTVYGFDVSGIEITREPAGIEFFTTENGISQGAVKNTQTLLEAGKKLIANGADGLAVVCFFEEPPEDDYENGEGIDVVGGVEAIISHYLTKELLCPCVHAPAFADVSITSETVSPKVSAEYITPTFLPCLFFGLKNAPLLINCNDDRIDNCLTYKNLHSVVIPHNSAGSSIVLDALEKNIPVYAIKENSTVLNVNGYSIDKQNDIIELDNYNDYINIIKSESVHETV